MSAAFILGVIAFVLAVWSASLIIRALVERAEVLAAKRRAERTGTPARLFGRPASGRHARAAIALGVGCLILSMGSAYAAIAIREMVSRGDAEVSPWSLALIALLTLAAACVMTGWWFDPPRGRRRCPKCWYDLSATPGLTCPECGFEAADESRLFRIRRKPALVWLAVLLLLSASAIPSARRVAKGDGLMGLIPTTFLIAGFTWLPEEWIYQTLGGRLYDQEGWDLQIRALHYLCDVEMDEPASATTFHRAITFGNHRTVEDLSLTPHARQVLVRALASSDPVERRAATAMFGWILQEAATGQTETITDDQAATLREDFLRGNLETAMYIPASLIFFGREQEAIALLQAFEPRLMTSRSRSTDVLIVAMWRWAADLSPRVIDVLINRIESAAPAGQRDLLNNRMRSLFEISPRLHEVVERIVLESPDDLTAALAIGSLASSHRGLDRDMLRWIEHFVKTRKSSGVTAFKNAVDWFTGDLTPEIVDSLMSLVGDTSIDEAVRAEIARFLMSRDDTTPLIPALPKMREFLASSPNLGGDPELARLLQALETLAASSPAAITNEASNEADSNDQPATDTSSADPEPDESSEQSQPVPPSKSPR